MRLFQLDSMGQSYKEINAECPGRKSLITESRNGMCFNSRKVGATLYRDVTEGIQPLYRGVGVL